MNDYNLYVLVLDKLFEITYLITNTALLHTPPSTRCEPYAMGSKRQLGFGGETASTGIKKLELHTERPVSSLK